MATTEREQEVIYIGVSFNRCRTDNVRLLTARNAIGLRSGEL